MDAMTTTESVEQYVQRRGITCTIVRDRGTQIEDGWEHHAYIVELALDGRTIETPWQQGLGVETSPEDAAADVLGSMLLDASGLYIFPDENEEEGFLRWAEEYGYDTDSRSAFRTYRAVVEQTDRLRAFLGDDWDHALGLRQD